MLIYRVEGRKEMKDSRLTVSDGFSYDILAVNRDEAIQMVRQVLEEEEWTVNDINAHEGSPT